MPFTIGKSINDYSAQVIYVDSTNAIVQIPYSEGLFIDYRHFDAVSSLFTLREAWRSFIDQAIRLVSIQDLNSGLDCLIPLSNTQI